MRALLPFGVALVFSLVVPLVVYRVARPHVSSDAVALAMATGVSLVGTLARVFRRRRLDLIGALSIAGFGIGLVVSVATGGSSLALELREPALTGLAGLACLASLALRRPLHLVVVEHMARRNPQLQARVDDPSRRTTSLLLTAAVGVTLLVRSAALIALALSASPGTYVAWSRPLGWSIIALAAAVLACYRRWLSRRPAGYSGP